MTYLRHILRFWLVLLVLGIPAAQTLAESPVTSAVARPVTSRGTRPLATSPTTRSTRATRLPPAPSETALAGKTSSDPPAARALQRLGLPDPTLLGQVTPRESALFRDAADGTWDDHALFEAALIASGVNDPVERRRGIARLDAIVAQLASSGELDGDDRHKARVLFDAMHETLLTGGYRIESTNLAETMEHGRFNCVSASVLFNCLAKRVGVRARGLELPGHAMSRLFLGDTTLDVETTCPGWFAAMDDPRRQAALVSRQLGERSRAAEGARSRREVNDVELVATIYFNRGVDLLGEKHFAAAVSANIKALLLDAKSHTARGNVLAALNNWSIHLASKAEYAEAVKRLRQGLAIDPEFSPFAGNFVHVHHQWLEGICRRGDYAQAIEILARARPDGIDRPWFAQAERNIWRGYLRTLLEGDHPESALALADRVELSDTLVSEVVRRSLALAKADRRTEAMALLDSALVRFPDRAVLESQRRVLGRNNP